MKAKASQFSILIRYNPDDPDNVDEPYTWAVVRGGQIQIGPKSIGDPLEEGRCSDYAEAAFQAKDAFDQILAESIEKPKEKYNENFD
jgi:hypothetical protein